jgi:hypothetical protein
MCFINDANIKTFSQFEVHQIAAGTFIFGTNPYYACLIHALT